MPALDTIEAVRRGEFTGEPVLIAGWGDDDALAGVHAEPTTAESLSRQARGMIRDDETLVWRGRPSVVPYVGPRLVGGLLLNGVGAVAAPFLGLFGAVLSWPASAPPASEPSPTGTSSTSRPTGGSSRSAVPSAVIRAASTGATSGTSRSRWDCSMGLSTPGRSGSGAPGGPPPRSEAMPAATGRTPSPVSSSSASPTRGASPRFSSGVGDPDRREADVVCECERGG